MFHLKGRNTFFLFLFIAVFWGTGVLMPQRVSAQSIDPDFIPPNTDSGLPKVVANDNLTPAGSLEDGVLYLDLEVLWADWRIENPDGPGLRVAALAVMGSAPSIPSPLIRVQEGTRIVARIHNSLSDSSATIFGLNSHPREEADSLTVLPGETGSVEFNAGAAGTYFYYMRIGSGAEFSEGRSEREQLAGAFVVDPLGGSPPDRIFVINIYSKPVSRDILANGGLEALTINGRSWPFTERMKPAVGDTLRWRVINASRRGHPMHLHGFFYDRVSVGSISSSERFPPEDRHRIVTEFMPGHTTMDMEWVASRPGNWLFHCHLSFHVWPEVRLPMAEKEVHGEEVHMAGLVIGIEVQPGPSDLMSKGEPKRLNLFANTYEADSTQTYGFSMESSDQDSTRYLPGPVLVFQQYEDVYVTVKNNMDRPTGVHWHGLELEGWADGVPGWSASNGKVSPAIQPGEEFTYRLSMMRPGTFIYHSHLNDVYQLTSGMYGALIVLPEGESYDPTTDHLNIMGWNDPFPAKLSDLALNGMLDQPDEEIQVGERHRLRLINIAPAGEVYMTMTGPDGVFPLHSLAMDGYTLPPNQQISVEASPAIGNGSTSDFYFTPDKPGEYELFVGLAPGFGWTQKWSVRPN